MPTNHRPDFVMTLQLKERGNTLVFLIPRGFCGDHNIKKGDWFEVTCKKNKED